MTKRYCCYCRSDLPESKSGNSADGRCEKCKKNEAKYKKKPTVCKYCRVPAAFFEDKCVWCAYSERKIGPPVHCAECNKNAAFTKDPLRADKPVFCRLCRKSKAKVKDTNVSEKSSESAKSSPLKRKNDAIDEPKAKVSKNSFLNEIGGEQSQSEYILTIQQFKDQILELKKTSNEKDRALLERDKQIASLNAEILNLQRLAKEKAMASEKQYQNTVKSYQEQVRDLNKQVRQLQRSN